MHLYLLKGQVVLIDMDLCLFGSRTCGCNILLLKEVEFIWKGPIREKGSFEASSQVKEINFSFFFLKNWNKRVSGHVSYSIKELKERIEQVDFQFQSGF